MAKKSRSISTPVEITNPIPTTREIYLKWHDRKVKMRTKDLAEMYFTNEFYEGAKWCANLTRERMRANERKSKKKSKTNSKAISTKASNKRQTNRRTPR